MNMMTVRKKSRQRISQARDLLERSSACPLSVWTVSSACGKLPPSLNSFVRDAGRRGAGFGEMPV
jgi:hypothetical protein